MGFGAMLDTAFLEANKAYKKFAGSYSSPAGKAAWTMGKSFTSRVGSTLRSTYGSKDALIRGGQALKLGAGAAVGAAGGYAYDGSDSSAGKGVLLGAFGAAAHTGWKSPAMRGLAKDVWKSGKSGWSEASSWAEGQYKRQVNAAHVRQAGRAGWTQ